jgi:signal transduction histidine kinase/thiol-disulfide isomerase/thioredoxin
MNLWPSNRILTPGNRISQAARSSSWAASRIGGAGDRIARLRRDGIRWPFWLDIAWVVVSLLNLAAIGVFGHWETMPLHLIWISLTVVYGFRVWATYPALWVLLALMVAISAATVLDVWSGTAPLGGLTEVPLMAVMFLTVAWHARREAAANREWHLISEENARLLSNQRRFLQDAAHQLRTPITIALGHAELLARELPGIQEGQDIGVVLGELTRLRRIAERLLVIAAAEAPGFLQLEPVCLDRFLMEVIRRWRPAAARHWQLGRLDKVTVDADKDQLRQAVDALLDNAVRHTHTGDFIKLSVLSGTSGGPARLLVTDGGSGIPAGQIHHIFERFRTVEDDVSRGTGLGLALVRAVAHAHGGDALVHSTPGEGSEFELLLPVKAAAGDQQSAAGTAAEATTWAPLMGAHEMGQTGLTGPQQAGLGEAAGRLAWTAVRVRGPGEIEVRTKMPLGARAASVRRMARQHKVASAVIAVCIAAVVAVSTVAATSGTATSPRAPAFTLSALGSSNGHISLAAYAGRPVIVNFFASWCVPCRKETPLMARFYRSAHGTAGIIGIDTNDSETAAEAFTRSAGVSYPVAFDPAAKTAGAFGVVAIPQTFFLNAEHRIVDRIYGAVTSAELAKGIARMGTSTASAASASSRDSGRKGN